ncbi:MAG: retroviral-like aspartic protease family protein [Candidatus Hydrogenedentota bacterium]
MDQSINFLLDTGASRTVISDKDAIFLKVDYDKLRKSSEKMFGIGGSVETYILDDTILIFKTNIGQLELKLPVLFLKHNIETMKKDDSIKILRIPSLLGRDVINKLKLIYNQPDNEIILIEPEIKLC